MSVSSEQIREMLKVYFIMGSENCEREPKDILNEAIQAGVSLFQFREKGPKALVGTKKLQLAKELKSICQTYKVPFIVNDDVDLAIALDADGVHIGQEDEPAAVVRDKIGNHKILGVSTHTVEEALAAIEQGADYLGIGPIYPTDTKIDAKKARGTILIDALRNSGLVIPVVGIGGIKPDNAEAVIKGGADGVAVITAISQAESVEEATRALSQAVSLGVQFKTNHR